MKILVVGSGGREHTLAWKVAQSSQVEQIFVAPGNAGTQWGAGADTAACENVPIGVNDFPALIAFAQQNGIDLTVVGPEDPLSRGIVGHFHQQGLSVFGPSAMAAQLESSKAFAKDFMRQMGIPTAAYATFSEYKSARDYVYQLDQPVVVKASGLAAGKGVIVCDTVVEADKALKTIMQERKFGSAGDLVLIEERLVGPEVSLLAFSDGRTVKPMLSARDHKRVYDNDEGPNTGGMGVYAPPPDVDSAWVQEIMETVLKPTVAGMAQQDTPYVGVLYAGLMLTADGPKVLEFNCRFGDPETQVILPMLAGDLVTIMLACLDGRLDEIEVQSRPGGCVAVVMASGGYPGSYAKGKLITGVESANALSQTVVFQAGTAVKGEQLVTNGGRVLAVTSWADDLQTAGQQAYAGVELIDFEGSHYRTDIGP